MSVRYLIKNKNARRKKAGISPVVATVILVAVAVVIAAALAGFAGSLFGSYSNGPQIKITSMTLFDDGTGTITMSNAGSADDAVTKVAVKGVGEFVYPVPADDTNTIPKNSNPITIDFDSVGATGLSSGQQVTAIISMQSGATITQTVTVEAAP